PDLSETDPLQGAGSQVGQAEGERQQEPAGTRPPGGDQHQAEDCDGEEEPLLRESPAGPQCQQGCQERDRADEASGVLVRVAQAPVVDETAVAVSVRGCDRQPVPGQVSDGIWVAQAG